MNIDGAEAAEAAAAADETVSRPSVQQCTAKGAEPPLRAAAAAVESEGSCGAAVDGGKSASGAKVNLWDINRRMAAYMDPHMLFYSILKWLKDKKAYSEESVDAAIMQVLSTAADAVVDVHNTSETGESRSTAIVKNIGVELLELESQLKSFIECLISERQKRSDGTVTGPLDRKTVQEWYVSWKAKCIADDEKAMKAMKAMRAEAVAVEAGQEVEELHYQQPRVVTKFPDNALELYLRYCRLFYHYGDFEAAQQRLFLYLDIFYEHVVEARERTDLILVCLWGIMAAVFVTLAESKSAPEAAAASQQVEIQGATQAASTAAATASNSNADGSSEAAAAEDDLSRDLNPPAAPAPAAPAVEDKACRIAQVILMADDLIEVLSLKRQNRQKTLLERTWLFHRAIWMLMMYYFPKVFAASTGGSTAAEHLTFNSHTVIPYHSDWLRLIEWLFSDRNINLICTVVPHILRYIAVIAIMNKQRQDHFKIAVDAIARCSEQLHSDPFTSILDALFVEYDFNKSHEKLALCGAAAEADYFLAPLKVALEENSRLLIFQTYCRIQKSIDIDDISRKLHMTPESAERWIVNLIRRARIEALIDSEQNRVEIATQTQNVYQQVIDKTKNLMVRTTVLVQQFERPAGTAAAGTGAYRLKGRGGGVAGEYAQKRGR